MRTFYILNDGRYIYSLNKSHAAPKERLEDHADPVKLCPCISQKVGLNAISALPSSKRDELFRFKPVDGKRATIIYAEHVVSVIGLHIPPRPHRTGAKKAAAKKAVHSDRGRRGPLPTAAEKQRVAYKAIRAARGSETAEQKSGWINSFISEFFDDIRKAICKKNAGKVGELTAIAAVADMLINHFGITMTSAHAIAIAVIYTIYSAAKNAFCKVTAVEARALVLGARSKQKTKPASGR
jgi:hypothetical protein